MVEVERYEVIVSVTDGVTEPVIVMVEVVGTSMVVIVAATTENAKVYWKSTSAVNSMVAVPGPISVFGRLGQ